jgi:alkylated DNA repair dioxygenase AlkB
MGIVVIDEDGARVEYVADFLDANERRGLRAEMDAMRGLFESDRLLLYGRERTSPRLVCAFGDDGLSYRYSGEDRATRPWTPFLLAIRDRLAAMADHPFNYALVNLYRNGDDCIGWHSDKESDLAPGASIASLSLGAARPFLLRKRGPGGRTVEVVLADGSLLWMKGATQAQWKHSLPRRRRIQQARYNVTFRHVLPRT